jgi:hypothetical protein
MPVAGFDPRSLWGSFTEARGTTRAHEAVDLPAPRGTPVLAVADGIVQKLFTSVRGGLTLYEFDLDGRYCYYYAHLDSYAPSILEGRFLRKGDVIGTVGSTGNANEKAPHLHFAVTLLGPEKKWWGGVPVDPYPLWSVAPRFPAEPGAPPDLDRFLAAAVRDGNHDSESHGDHDADGRPACAHALQHSDLPEGRDEASEENDVSEKIEVGPFHRDFSCAGVPGRGAEAAEGPVSSSASR